MPMSRDQIVEQLRALQAADLPTHGGRALAYVYDSGLAEADQIGREALAMFASANGLDPTAFPSLLQMENDLVATAGQLLHAPDGFVGSVTSGGTESILLAVLAARDARREVREPSMVLPSTAHAAFHKAAHYYGVRPVIVEVGDDFRADPAAMAAAIDESCVLVVCSAPSYAHGVVDPVVEVAAAAASRGVRCHVDACIGGWVLPWLDDAPAFDFAVPGVTSISVDLHKYAYTPKGVSVLLHRDASLRRSQFFASAQWPGYTMLNSTTQSTRSGGPLAAAWAVVQAIGLDGYAGLARVARQATLDLAAAVRERDGLRLLVEPDSTLLAFTSADPGLDVFVLSDELLGRGWFVQPQLSFRGGPASLHLSLSAATASGVTDFVTALDEAIVATREQGPAPVPEQVAGLIGQLDPTTLDEAGFVALLGAAGLVSSEGELALPIRMAPVNALLDLAAPQLREVLLLAVLDQLMRPNS